MSKVKEVVLLIDEIIEAGTIILTEGQKILNAINDLKKCFSEEPKAVAAKKTKAIEAKAEVPATEEIAIFTKEDVRKLLADKSTADGGAYKPAVKALVKKYSSTGQLSDIPAEQYAEVVAELGAIGNA